jgi:hypothetical protein
MHINVSQLNAPLGGFVFKKPHTQPPIFFDKESILSKFNCFLKGEISVMNDKGEEKELMEIDRKGSSDWNDWSEFNNYNADEVDEKDKEIAEN